MLIERNTQISQLRYLGIIDNIVFSILRSNGFRNVEDIMRCSDFEQLGIKDYVVKSLKAFLRQMLMYEATLNEIKEDEKLHKNPQLDQAVDDALASPEMTAARDEGTLIFNDVVDLVSFLLIDTDDEYYDWLQQKGIDDQQEMEAQLTTCKLLMNVRDNLNESNRYNLYIRLIDHVLKLDRFRKVVWQVRNGRQQQNMAPRTDSQDRNIFQDRNNFQERKNFRDQRDNFMDQHDNFPEQRDDMMGMPQPTETPLPPTPFRMIDDEEVVRAANDYFFANGHYPMFSIMISYLKKAKVMGTVRMASVIGVAESKEKEDWTKMEARRRYIDGVNRGLGLPADRDLQDILESEHWESYGFDKFAYFSERDYPLEELCQKEKIDISFNLFAFFICIIRKMAMVNIQVGKAHNDEPGSLENVHTYVVPAEYMNFSYTSFVTVTANRIKEFASDREAYKTFLLSSITQRFWRGEVITSDRREFIRILKDILAELFGIYADDITLVSELKVRDEEPRRRESSQQPEAKTETSMANGEKRKYKKRNGKFTIMQAIMMVLEKNGPMMSSDVVKSVLELNPDAKETSIKVIMANGRSAGTLEYKPNGLLGIVEGNE